jgi:nucleoside-diphosphate-sugar epimerase
MKNILVTGGTGQVGKELQKLLPNAYYIGSKDFDLTNENEVISLFKSTQFNTVIHLAAKVGGIIDNIKNPAVFYDKNILMNTLILKHSYLSGVENFLGILSTCIYPDHIENYPIKEDDLHKGIPAASNLAYGYAKRAFAVQIDAYNQQYKTNYNYIIPCNLYGLSEHEDINTLHFVNALINKIAIAVKTQQSKITLFGDGTPRRQFIHARDLARIINETINKNIKSNFNVAGDDNFSIKEMAELALQITNNTNIQIEFDTSKPNGQLRKDVDNSILRKHFPDFKFTSFNDGVLELYNKYINE